MLDWIASKAAMAVVAMLLLASAAGFFSWQQEDAVHRRLQVIADDVAQFLDSVSSLRGDAAFTFSPVHAGGYAATVAGDATYEIELDRTAVLITRGSATAFAILGSPVHLFLPDRRNYTLGEVTTLDAEHDRIHLSAHGTVDVLRWLIVVDGSELYATFVSLPQS